MSPDNAMIDHVGITVGDFGRRKAFYSRALAPTGRELLMEFPAAVTGSSDVAGFGVPPKPDFWIAAGTPNVPSTFAHFHGRYRRSGLPHRWRSSARVLATRG